MGKKQKSKASKANRSIKTLVLYCFLVCVVIIAGLIVKSILIINASHYDGKHQFILGFVRSDKDVDVVAVDPLSDSVAILNVKTPHIAEVQKDLGIPFNATILVPRSTESGFDFVRSLGFLWKRPKENLTIYDRLRLMLFFRTVSSKKQTSGTLTLPKNFTEIDPVVSRLFPDASVQSENKTIEIVNATGQSGIGARMERVLNNIGATVIDVATGRVDEDVSKLYYTGEKSYTVERLEKILSLSAEQTSEQTISDIKIVIGKDKLSNPFLK